MKNQILKLALGALALAALGFAGYRFMKKRDTVEIQYYAVSVIDTERAAMQEELAEAKSVAKNYKS